MCMMNKRHPEAHAYKRRSHAHAHTHRHTHISRHLSVWLGVWSRMDGYGRVKSQSDKKSYSEESALLGSSATAGSCNKTSSHDIDSWDESLVSRGSKRLEHSTR